MLWGVYNAIKSCFTYSKLNSLAYVCAWLNFFFCKISANCYFILSSMTSSYMSINCVSQSESSSALWLDGKPLALATWCHRVVWNAGCMCVVYRKKVIIFLLSNGLLFSLVAAVEVQCSTSAVWSLYPIFLNHHIKDVPVQFVGLFYHVLWSPSLVPRPFPAPAFDRILKSWSRGRPRNEAMVT